MDIFDLLTMLGGLSLFLFGMNVMGQGLEHAAGNKLKDILERMTASPFRGFLLGVGVTAVIQSSSATTVMVVGFVNSGIMKLEQAVGIIMGANVGTTVTAWIISLTSLEGDSLILQLCKPTTFSPILALIGTFMYMSSDGKKKNLGSILLGFATLMFGMDTMSGAVAGLKEVPQFTSILTMFSNPILGVLAGAFITAVIQSSSASVGILQAVATTGALSFSSAVPIIMGQNIGTCVTAMISSVGANKNARRAALIHLYFNVIGTAVCLAALILFHALVGFPFYNTPIHSAGIAVVHTVFNVICTIIMYPFHRLLVKLAYLTVREDQPEPEIALLDERLMITPFVALEQSRKLVCAMASLSHTAVVRALELFNSYDEEKARLILDVENQLDQYEDIVSSYLVKLSSRSLSVDDSRAVSLLLHSISDFERISDHAKKMTFTAQRMREKSLTMSPAGAAELEVLAQALDRVTKLTADSFIDQNRTLARQVEPLEEVVDRLCVTIRERHIVRLQEGVCSVDVGLLFTDLLGDCARVSDHCSNVAAALIEVHHDQYDSHQYLNDVKKNDEFKRQYEVFEKEFALR